LGEQRAFGGPDSGALDVLASIVSFDSFSLLSSLPSSVSKHSLISPSLFYYLQPYFLIGAAGAGIAWAQEKWEGLSGSGRRGGYRTVQVDDDAEILRGAYEDD